MQYNSRCKTYYGWTYEDYNGNIFCSVSLVNKGADHWFFDKIVPDEDGNAMIKNTTGNRVNLRHLDTPLQIYYLDFGTIVWVNESNPINIRDLTETFDAFFKWLDEGREMFEAQCTV